MLVTNKVIKNVLCLYKNKFYYTDIKSQNIFYECHSDEQKHEEKSEISLTVCLGDYGGISRDLNDTSKVTFHPPERLDELKITCNDIIL
jgi:hypothetical protein